MRGAVLALAALGALGGCVAPQAPGAVGMPNPASVHCRALGGQTQIRTDATGAQSGWCRLPGGRVVDEWALFRGEIAGLPRG